MSDRSEIERLTARLDRERRTRREAELIAERGLRELWQVNRDLDDRVAERTAHLERELVALASIHQLVVGAAGDDLAWVRATLEIPSPSTAPSTAAPVAITDRIGERWQRLLARSGHLLSIDVDPSMPPALVRWDALIGAVDLVLVGIHRRRRGGPVTVTIRELPFTEPPSLSLTIAWVPARGGADDDDDPRPGELAHLTAAASELVRRAAGSLVGTQSTDHGLRIEWCIPEVATGDAGGTVADASDDG